MTKQSRELEILVHKIQRQLAPNTEVLHDVRLPGKFSKRDRQIDVLVRQKIGQYEMLIVLDCKDYARPNRCHWRRGVPRTVSRRGRAQGRTGLPQGLHQHGEGTRHGLWRRSVQSRRYRST